MLLFTRNTVCTLLCFLLSFATYAGQNGKEYDPPGLSESRCDLPASINNPSVYEQTVNAYSESGYLRLDSIKYCKDQTQFYLTFIGDGEILFCLNPLGSGHEFRVVDEATGREYFPIAQKGDFDVACSEGHLFLNDKQEANLTLTFKALPNSVHSIRLEETTDSEDLMPEGVQGIRLKRE